MTDWDRLLDYIYDYFPEPIYTTREIQKWAMKNVPAWKYMDSDTQTGILNDWVAFIEPQKQELERAVIETVAEKVSREFVEKEKSFFRRIVDNIIDKVRRFLGRRY